MKRLFTPPGRPGRGLRVSVLRDEVNHRAEIAGVAARAIVPGLTGDVEKRYKPVGRRNRDDVQITRWLNVAMKRHSGADRQRHLLVFAGLHLEGLRVASR